MPQTDAAQLVAFVHYLTQESAARWTWGFIGVPSPYPSVLSMPLIAFIAFLRYTIDII